MKVMLCSTKIDKLIFPAYVQEKYDGARCIFRGGKLYSRAGSEFTNLPVVNFLPQNVILDGELIFPHKDRQTSNGLANKSIKGSISKEDAATAQLILWDCITEQEYMYGRGEKTYTNRLALLHEVTYNLHPNILLATTGLVFDEEDIFKRLQEHLIMGKEGIICKNMQALWESRRSPNCVKFKAVKTADLRVVDMIEGQGKYEGTLGALVCESDDKRICVKVGGGFTDSERDFFWNQPVGMIIEVLYNQSVQDKRGGPVSLYLPRFKCLRTDKTCTTTYEELA